MGGGCIAHPPRLFRSSSETYEMSDNKPRKPFTLAADGKRTLRTKDNAKPRIRPPQQVQKPAPNLAPPGMSGLRLKPGTTLARPQSPTSDPKPAPTKRFGLHTSKGQLTRTFKPLVNGKDKARRLER